MSIVPMNFVQVSCDLPDLPKVLELGLSSGLLHPELAAHFVTEENGRQLLPENREAQETLSALQTLSHCIGYHLKRQPSSKTYTSEEMASTLELLKSAFGLSSEGEHEQLSADDEKAIQALSVCGFERMASCQYLIFGMGRIPAENFKKLSLYRDDEFVHHRLHQNKQYIWLCYVTSPSYQEKVKDIFRSLYFEPMILPQYDVAERIEIYSAQMDDLYTFCLTQSEYQERLPYVFLGEDNRGVLSGFLPKKDVEKFQSLFSGLSVSWAVQDPAEVPELHCPTELHHGWFSRPFELFVEMYGLPDYGDLDPTTFFALTYALLFGIMFGDMGQGLFLLIIGLLFEKKGKLFGIIARCGLTSSIFGFLFGSLFGYEDALNPLHQQLFHVREKLFDVLASSNTMTLLLSALILGAVLILSAMVLNMIGRFRRKQPGEALFSPNGLAGFILYAFILVSMGFKLATGASFLLTPPWLLLGVAFPLLCFLLKEPLSNLILGERFAPESSWGSYITESLFECIETLLSFATNTLSFLRVGGFVLSHAGMMLVVMTLVEMSSHGGPFVLLFGNLFVLLLEGLVVGIQSLRLEYYELFSRYYLAGGKKYQPIQTNLSAMDKTL